MYDFSFGLRKPNHYQLTFCPQLPSFPVLTSRNFSVVLWFIDRDGVDLLRNPGEHVTRPRSNYLLPRCSVIVLLIHVNLLMHLFFVSWRNVWGVFSSLFPSLLPYFLRSTLTVPLEDHLSHPDESVRLHVGDEVYILLPVNLNLFWYFRVDPSFCRTLIFVLFSEGWVLLDLRSIVCVFCWSIKMFTIGCLVDLVFR